MSAIAIFRQRGRVESFRRETITQRNQSGSVLDCWLAVLGGRTSNQRVHEDWSGYLLNVWVSVWPSCFLSWGWWRRMPQMIAMARTQPLS